MPMIFYYGQDELNAYRAYTKGHHWNSEEALTDVPNDGPNGHSQTEAGIKECITCTPSRFADTSGVPDGKKLFALLRGIATGETKDRTFYVLKGIHTKPKLHLSIGFETLIYHLNVARLGTDNTKFSIHTFSAGEVAMDDPEWKVVKK